MASEGIHGRREPPLERGAPLLHQGERTRAVYMTVDGCLILRETLAAGGRRVVGLRLPGELVGVQHYARTLHSYTARAVTETLVCRLELRATRTRPSNPYLLERLLVKYAMQTERTASTWPGSPAVERVAAFVENYALRARVNGVGNGQFRLPMTRADIGSYLGLAAETVVRALAELSGSGRLSVHGRAICLGNASPATTAA